MDLIQKKAIDQLKDLRVRDKYLNQKEDPLKIL